MVLLREVRAAMSVSRWRAEVWCACLVRCVAFLVAVSVAGCATTNKSATVAGLPESGQRELANQKFRGRWWSYYQRGAILMRYGRYAEAEEDFRVAMSKRSEDNRWARTYGLHFLPEYFPNRELGIALFEQGDFEGAEEHLARSYNQAESARGAYYLDRVRERRIRDRSQDQAPPVIDADTAGLTGPVGEVVYLLRARVSDDTYVKSVSVNGRDVPLGVTKAAAEIEHELDLGPGGNAIDIVATDIVGNRTTLTLEITADHDGPAMTYEIAAGGSELRGLLADETGIEQLTIDGQAVARTALANGDEAFAFPIDSARLNAGVGYIVRDLLGNETQGTIVRPSAGPLARRANIAVALDAGDLSSWYAAAVTDESDSAGSLPLSVRFLNLADNQRYYTADIIASIDLESDSAVTGLQLNGEDIPGIIATSGPQRVSRRIHLAEVGEHRIVVRATNRNEVVAENEVVIERRLPQVLENKARLSVAVLGNLWVGGADVIPDVVRFVASEMPAAVASNGRFSVLGPESLPKILEEQELSVALSDPKEAVRTGRIEGTDYLLIGDARRYGPNIEIVLHAIDAANGRRISVDVYGPGSSTEDVSALTSRLSERLAQAFPLAHGGITSIERSGASLVAAFGARDLVWDSLPCIVYREVDMRDPATGQSLGKDMIPVAEGVVAKVRDETSLVELGKPDEVDDSSRPVPTDRVIMK